METENQVIYALAGGIGFGEVIIFSNDGEKGVINAYNLDRRKYDDNDALIDMYYDDLFISTPNKPKTIEEYFKKYQDKMYNSFTVEFDRDSFLNFYSSDLFSIELELVEKNFSLGEKAGFVDDGVDVMFMGVPIDEMLYRYVNVIIQSRTKDVKNTFDEQVFDLDGIKVTSRCEQLYFGVEF